MPFLSVNLINNQFLTFCCSHHKLNLSIGINWPSNVNRTILCPLFVGKLRLTYFLRISLLALLNNLFTTSKTYLLLELLSFSPQIWNLCSWHKFDNLLCNDFCNFAPSSFYEVNRFKVCNPHSWLTSYLSFGARYQKSLHNKNPKYLDEHCCQVTRF